MLFNEQTAGAIVEAVETFDATAVDVSDICAFAQQFDTELFKRKIQRFVQEKLEERSGR